VNNVLGRTRTMSWEGFYWWRAFQWREINLPHFVF
jgi:hypothetical protein